MSAFNAGRVIFKMVEKPEELHAGNTEQIPISLLEEDGVIPVWLIRHYINEGSIISDEKKDHNILYLLDGDITWLFFREQWES